MTRLTILLAALALPVRLEGQTLAQRVAAASDGTVRVSFAARRGVCSNGGHNITVMSDDEHEEWESDCTPGPVRVSLSVSRGGPAQTGRARERRCRRAHHRRHPGGQRGRLA